MAARPQEKALSFRTSVRRLLGHLAPERLPLLGAVVMALIGVGLNVLGPKLLGLATDVVFAGVIGAQLPAGITKAQAIDAARAQGNADFAAMLERMNVVPGQGIQYDELLRFILLTALCYLIAALVLIWQGYVLNGAIQRSIYRMREELAGKLQRLPLSYFDNQPRGELLSRVTNDIDNISQTLQQTLSQLLTALLTVVGVMVMMFLISPTLALVALITIPLTLVVVAIVGSRAQKLFVQNWKYTGELNAHIEEAFTGHSLVKVFGRQREVEAVFAERNAKLFGAGFGSQFVSGLIMPLMMFIGNLNYVVVAVVGGLKVASGTMNLGDVQAFIQYSRQFTQPLTQVASMANLMQSGVASAERVFEVLDAEEESPDPAGSLPPITGEVQFDDVSFRYVADSPLIEHLNLTVQPGQTVAIVGPTGAGKTTLVNLVLRFYELSGGTIRVDGVDITTVPRADLRGGIGMVLQDTWLFHGTIRENIAYGRPSATEAEIMDAARAAYVDRFVRSLPEGYETVIDEEGSNVSAGEKQLITIARAFLANPSLLILDEATSSVDTRTEVLVQKAMNSLRAARTSFVIAHRLSTIRDADIILVMENGSIVEQGDHEELLRRKGHYFDLYQSQFSAPMDELDPADSAAGVFEATGGGHLVESVPAGEQPMTLPVTDQPDDLPRDPGAPGAAPR